MFEAPGTPNVFSAIIDWRDEASMTERSSAESTLGSWENFELEDHMQRNLFIGVALVVTLLLVSGPVLAHHGTNLYDMMKTTTLKGTLTKFEWGNPHNQIYFDVTDDKGVVEHWNVETEPPAVMSERGWTRKALNPGDRITVYLNAAKNGATVGILQKVVLDNGKELTARDPQAQPGKAAP
jgi:hypothetical protein